MIKSPEAIDAVECERVEQMIGRIRDAGFTEEAEVFSNAYWGFLKLASAYVCAHPYVKDPSATGSEFATSISVLCAFDYAFNHWTKLVPASPKLDDQAVLKDAAIDEAWHQQEDLRMRREAGERP